MTMKKSLSIGLMVLAMMFILSIDPVEKTDNEIMVLSVNEIHNYDVTLIEQVQPEPEEVTEVGAEVETEKATIEVAEVKETSSYKEYDVPNYSGKKSWMSYKAIKNHSSPQWKLQQQATTDENGFRKVDGLYCVAVGTHFGVSVGTKIDLILENGTVINCVVGDIKSNKHTDEANIFTANGCMSEFIIDKDSLNKAVKRDGNCSSLKSSWNSPVKKVLVYDKNILR